MFLMNEPAISIRLVGLRLHRADLPRESDLLVIKVTSSNKNVKIGIKKGKLFSKKMKRSPDKRHK